MKRILISDLDGTLLNSWNNIHEITLEHINVLRKKNHGFAIATGRNIQETNFLKEKYNLNCDFKILLNGALILDKDSKIIRKKTINKNGLVDLIDIAKKRNLKLFFSNGDIYMTLKEFGNISVEDIKFKEYNCLAEMLTFEDEIVSASFIGDEDDIKKLDDAVSVVNKSQEIEAFRNVNFVDIVPKGISKGEAVKYIEKHMDLNDDNIYVIGDSWNDVSMLSKYKNSYTFTSSEEKIKTYAGNLVNNINECIQEVIEG